MRTDKAPRLAALHYQRGYDIDRLLVDVCASLSSAGLRLGGLLQVSTGDRGGNFAATVHVLDLRTRTSFDIWQDRGPCAQGCRLDEGGLAAAEVALHGAIGAGVDLMIVNRFGRAESLGRGLRACFEAAMAADIAILTAVREPYDAAWRDFHGGLGIELDCSAEAVAAWTKPLAGDRSRLVIRNLVAPFPSSP